MTLEKPLECVQYFLVLFVLASPGLSALGAEHWTSMTPEERLDKVLSLRHGPIGHHLDDDTRQLVETVLDDPETYCPLIDQRLRVSDEPLELAEFDVYARLGGATRLAKLLGTVYCSGPVERFFDEILRSFKSLRSTSTTDEDDDASVRRARAARGNCGALLISTLKILQDFDDPHALEACVAMIESFRPEKGEAGKVHVMLDYMAQVAPQKPACRTQLERMHNDRGSRLYHQPRLKQVIDAIDARASARIR